MMTERARNREYFQQLSCALHRPGLVERELRWEERHDPRVRGLRVLVQAFREPVMA